jgi:hypothetical protein
MRSIPTEDLEQRRSILREKLYQVGDLRLGSLIYRYRKCGKPTCACSDPEHGGHGGWVISKKLAGRTFMSTVPNEEQLEGVKQQLEEGRRFWKLAEEFAEASDELSRRQLTRERAEAKATAKKGASKSPLRPRSPGRSKR